MNMSNVIAVTVAAVAGFAVGCSSAPPGQNHGIGATDSNRSVEHAAPDDAGGSSAEGDMTASRTDTNYTLDTNPDLGNPERGVAYWATSVASNPNGTPGSFHEHTLEYHFLWLGDVCDAPLVWHGRNAPSTSASLRDWAKEAIELRDNGKKAIFRPRYDSQGQEGLPNRCGKVEGASYAQMKDHIAAIAAMLGDPEIKPSIAFIEMGYLGSWGEWNTAGVRNAVGAKCETAIADCRAYAPVLLAETPTNDRIHLVQDVVTAYRSAGVTRSVALRRPEFHRDAVENLGVSSLDLGFHNDCFMSSDLDDVGTFARLRWDYTDYQELYPKTLFSDAAAAKTYLQNNAGNGSVGGETCVHDNNEPWREPGVAARLEADRFQYLHGGFAPDFRQTMVVTGQWDAIKSRLGYRYQVSSVTYPSAVVAGAAVTLNITVENSGFAKAPGERSVYLALRGPANYVVGSVNPAPDQYALVTPEAQSNATLRSWNSGTTTTFSQTFNAPSAAGTYAVHLYIPDPDCASNSACSDAVRANYAVRLATKRNGMNVFAPSTGTNDLGVSLTVTDPT